MLQYWKFVTEIDQWLAEKYHTLGESARIICETSGNGQEYWKCSDNRILGYWKWWYNWCTFQVDQVKSIKIEHVVRILLIDSQFY